jgi:hypothetical protein
MECKDGPQVILMLIENETYNYDRPSHLILKEFAQVLLFLSKKFINYKGRN